MIKLPMDKDEVSTQGKTAVAVVGQLCIYTSKPWELLALRLWI